MPAIRATVFAGMLPIRGIRLLPEEVSSRAVNVRTDGGVLRGMNAPRTIKTIKASTKTVYRLPYNSSNVAVPNSDLDNSTWLEFDDINTDVLRSPTVNDSFDRYYWCSPSTKLRYATRAELIAGGTGRLVGILPPTVAPNVETVEGTGELDEEGNLRGPMVTRSYVVTFISIYGEESAPSPPSEAVGAVDQDWMITSIPQPSGASDRTPIKDIRIYRTITAASGRTTFFKVADVPVGTAVYNDQRTDSVVSAGTQLDSTAWAPPPEMDGITAMPNGIFVGFKGNNIYFSENYRPHAWPAEYSITVQYPVVGLGVFGNTCVIATSGAPAAVSGVKSSTMALVQSNTAAPCLSRGSVVSTLDGVFYASDNGLVHFGPAGLKNVTEQIISRDGWLLDYKPTTHRAAASRGQYITLRGNPGAVDGFMMAPTSPASGLAGVVDADVFTAAVNIGTDPWSGRVWLIDNMALREWDPAEGVPARGIWRSKEFHLPRPGNLSVAQAFFNPPEVPDASAVRLRVWADRRLVYNQPVPVAEQEMRLPSGFKAAIWQFELEIKTTVHAVHLASTVTELRNV